MVLTIHTRKWFLGAPPISLTEGASGPIIAIVIVIVIVIITIVIIAIVIIVIVIIVIVIVVNRDNINSNNSNSNRRSLRTRGGLLRTRQRRGAERPIVAGLQAARFYSVEPKKGVGKPTL